MNADTSWSSLTLTTVAGAVAATTGAALILRAIKRAFSPTIKCHLSCECGKIQGNVRAKWEDSIRIYCYCKECRLYANYIASLGNKQDKTIGMPYGDNRVVQVCKSAITIDQGQELLGLARMAPPDDSGKVYMHRFYAKCCHVPLMNTVDFLGFVGVFTDFLDENHKKFNGPVCMFDKEALQDPKHREADIFVPDFLWKLIRYLPWRSSGPFNYSQEPVYWGGGKDTENKKGI